MTLQSELARLKDLEAKATFKPTGHEQMCSACHMVVSVEWDLEWEDGDICDACANDLGTAALKALPKLIKTIEIQQEVIRKVKSNRDGKEQIEALWTE